MTSRNRSTIIDTWLAGLNEDQREDWLVHVKQNYHNLNALHSYLVERGVQCSLTAVYNWKQRNATPGIEANSINEDNSEYNGINPMLVCNRLLATLHKVTVQYYEIIDRESDAITLNQAILSLPTVSREMRAVAALLHGTNWQLDFESAVLQGATRIAEIMLSNCRDAAEEPYVVKLIESAMLQMKEEAKYATQRVQSS